jgi:hypothetical protein
MTQITAVFDGIHFNESTQAYALQFAQQTKAHLVGAFLSEKTHTTYDPINLIFEPGDMIGSSKRKWDKKDVKKRAAARESFGNACMHAGVSFSIQKEDHNALKDLIHESMFTDMLVICRNETFDRAPVPPPGPFLKRLLTCTHCPVLIVPKVYSPPHSAVVLYNAKPVSVDAFKSFTYILGSMQLQQIDILFVQETARDMTPGLELLEEWTRSHFPIPLQYKLLRGEPQAEVVNYLGTGADKPLVILGPTTRGKICTYLHESIFETLAREVENPIFIIPTR